MKAYRVRAAVVAVAAGLTLSACGGGMPSSAAAVVGEERITYSDLESMVQGYYRDLAARKIPADQLQLPIPLPKMVLYNVANVRQVIQFARGKGLTVSETDIDEFVESRGGEDRIDTLLLQSGIPLAERRTALLATVIQDKLRKSSGAGEDQQAQQEAMQKIMQEVDAAIPVTFSRRYGKWDDQKGFADDERFGAIPPSG